MVLLRNRKGDSISTAVGTDLTQWNNAGVKLAVGELNAIDWFKTASIMHSKPKDLRINPMPATHIQKRINDGVLRGRIATSHWLQTGIYTYYAMGACTTTGGPAYTHTITKQTTETPISIAFHTERTGVTTSRLKDLVGCGNNAIDIYVSEESTRALQVFSCDFSESVPADDVTQPTLFLQATNPPLTWFDLQHASGATSFKYNLGDFNFEITEIHMHMGWSGALFGPFDSDAYPTDCRQTPPYDAYVELGGRITDAGDNDIHVISDLKQDAYAGDIIYIADFYRSADDTLKYTWTDMYIEPSSYEEVFMDDDSWYEGVKFKLNFRNETSTVGCIDINDIAKTSYEND